MKAGWHYAPRQQWAALAVAVVVLLACGAHRLLRPPAPGLAVVPLSAPAAQGLPAQPAMSKGQPAPVKAQPAAACSFPVDVNSATAAELEAVPGIGPKLAQAILTFRAEQGGFAQLDDLKLVKGIKDKRLKRFAPYLKAGALAKSPRPLAARQLTTRLPRS